MHAGPITVTASFSTPARRRAITASLAAACAAALLAVAPARAQDGDSAGPGSRLTPMPVEMQRIPHMRAVITQGPRAPKESGGGAATGVCPPVDVVYVDPDLFMGGQLFAEAGLVEGEISAVSYVVPAADFPLRVDVMQWLVAGSNVVVPTTTQWSVLVWEGIPTTGNLVASFSSDDIILPHIVLPPGANVAVTVQVTVDPQDPEPIIVTDNGSHTFTVGFRIDVHNDPPTAPCFPLLCSPGLPAQCCPPDSSTNVFPTVDTNGLANPTNNWLFAQSCQGNPCAAPAGWHRFSQLGLFQPSGDWVISATYTPFFCPDAQGACCITSGMQCQDLTQIECDAVSGTWNGGTTCASFACFPIGACCLTDGGCVADQSPAECTALGGAFQGDGESCTPNPCPVPTGACCVPEGCADPVSAADCVAAGGTWLGADTTCAVGACVAACCFQPTGCVDLSLENCLVADGFWQGPGTACGVTICFPSGACCFPDGSCGEDVAEADCTGGGGIFQGDGVLCASVSCPQPIGGCCLSNGNCLVLTEANCVQIPNAAWSGALTDCADANGNGTADVCESCEGDFDATGDVGFSDLLFLLAAWGPCPACPEDLDGTGDVGFSDLLVMLSLWGPC